MSRDVEALRAMWPSGIPLNEYERAARLLRTLASPTAREPVPAAQPAAPVQRRKKKRGGTTVGADTLARVRALLATGPATARDLSAATGISEHNVYVALRQLGAVQAGKVQRVDGRAGLQPSLYALEATP